MAKKAIFKLYEEVAVGIVESAPLLKCDLLNDLAAAWDEMQQYGLSEVAFKSRGRKFSLKRTWQEVSDNG